MGGKTEEEAKNREGKESESSEKGKAIRDPQSSVDCADSSYVKG